MTTPPTNFIECEAAAAEMIQEYARLSRQLDSAVAQIKAARDGLDKMALDAPHGYRSLGTFLTQMATENPDDAVWTNLAARMDRARTEFAAKRTEVGAIVTAIDGA